MFTRLHFFYYQLYTEIHSFVMLLEQVSPIVSFADTDISKPPYSYCNILTLSKSWKSYPFLNPQSGYFLHSHKPCGRDVFPEFFSVRTRNFWKKNWKKWWYL